MTSPELVALALLGLTLGACAGPEPRPALEAYARALIAQDAAGVRARADAATRAAVDEQAVAARLAEDPAAAAALGQALLDAPRLEQTAEARLPDGRVVRLVLEADGWRVAAGGLDGARYDTPERAFATLVRAARAGRLDEVRGAMPEAFAARYASDAALAEHLEAVRPRLEAAWAALAPLEPGIAIVDGETARIPWGNHRAVRLAREGGRWRVLDAE